ncbi:MAG: beta-ketoacyl-ACP synthase I, partial [Wohlfahrtiimonas sp.]
IDNVDPLLEGFPIVREKIEDIKINNIMSNSFGFGGTNATVVLSRYKD